MKKSEKLIVELFNQGIVDINDLINTTNLLLEQERIRKKEEEVKKEESKKEKEEVKKEEKDSKAVDILEQLGFNTYKEAPKKEEVKPELEKSSFTKFILNLVIENYKPKTENGSAIWLKIIDLVKVKDAYQGKQNKKEFNEKLYKLGAALALFESDLFDEIEKKVWKSYLVKSAMDKLAKSLKTEVK